MDLHLDLGAGAQLVDQIYAQLRTKIITGVLAVGDRLPSSRELAERLSVSRARRSRRTSGSLPRGLVRTRRGVGVYAAREPVRNANVDGLGRSSIRPRSQWLEPGLAVPPPPGPSSTGPRIGTR